MQTVASNKLNHLEVRSKAPEIVLIWLNFSEVVSNVLNFLEIIKKQSELSEVILLVKIEVCQLKHYFWQG